MGAAGTEGKPCTKCGGPREAGPSFKSWCRGCKNEDCRLRNARNYPRDYVPHPRPLLTGEEKRLRKIAARPPRESAVDRECEGCAGGVIPAGCRAQRCAACGEGARAIRLAKNRSKTAERAALRPPSPPYVPPADKRCSKCGEVKPLALFGPHQQTRDGRNSWCRSCVHAHDPAGRRSRKAKRRAGKLNATPAWANPVAICEFYAAAKICERDTGDVWHVDHIVPLNNPHVCGLHCEANLQLLPGALNVEKSNRFWPGMP